MKHFTIPATDLTFGSKCPACLWAKHNEKWREPWSPFPSVFGHIDKAQKRHWTGTNLRRLGPTLPSFNLEPGKSRLKSEPIAFEKLGVTLTLSGDIDLYGTDGQTSVIVDAKTSSIPTPEKAKEQALFYAPQLMLYRHAAMHPADPKKFVLPSVEHLGLMIMGIGDIYPTATWDGWIMDVPHAWVPIPVDELGFMALLRQKAELLGGSKPEDTDGCHWCQLRSLRKIAAKLAAKAEAAKRKEAS